MKNYLQTNCTKKLFFVLFLLPSLFSFSQDKTFNDVLNAKKVYFYGYDFTHFKLIEPKRNGQDAEMKGFIFELIQMLNDKNKEKEFERYIQKDTVIFAQETVNDLNTKIKQENILNAFIKPTFSKDTLQNIINQYDTKGKTGIGFVEVMECFYKQKKETSIWYVFFDIATKQIIDAYETTNDDADSYHGLAAYWAVGVHSGMGSYRAKHYYPALKDLKKK